MRGESVADMTRHLLPLPLISAIAPAFLLAADVFAQTPPDFQREVRPILSNNCFHCHGPDEAERKGGDHGLRLDTEEGAMADLGGYKAIVPGKPEESEVYKRLITHDADELMPPGKSGKKLTAREVDLVKRWIASGAKFAKHWAYEKPVRPPVPEIRNPQSAIPSTPLSSHGWRKRSWRRSPRRTGIR